MRGLYVILDDHGDGGALLRLAECVLDAGVRVVQYRAKRGVDADVLRRLRALTAARSACLIVNDDPESTLRAGADGVHLGQEDAQVHTLRAVRERLAGKVLGVSCATAVEAAEAAGAGADYVGVGSVFATSSKADAGPPIGLAALRAVVKTSPVPVVAIGGICAQNIADVARSGAAMAAVISAVAAAGDPGAAVRDLIARWEAA